MADRWTGWKSFPDDYHGEYIQAPMGPGLFEVCRASTRAPVAFGCTRNVADSLGDVLKPRGLRKWQSLPGQAELRHRRAGIPDLADGDGGGRQAGGRYDS